MFPVDFIIVGQGIAGTILSETLFRRGKKCVVIDDWNYSSSSKISAGLYNPIVFKRLNKSWIIDDLLPVAESFYSRLEEKLNDRFLFKKKIIKIFYEINENEFWLKKSKEDGLKKYLTAEIIENLFPEVIRTPYGAGIVKEGGNVDVRKMLILFRDLLKMKKCLIEERFNYSELLLHGEFVEYKGVRAQKIIFCEGFRASENPWFKWLPFKLSKGEIITIMSNLPWTDLVINKGVFILPLGDNKFKVGSTHNWTELNENPSEPGKLELCEKLERLIKIPYRIISHEAGVRPTVSDRRPLIGFHSQFPNLGVFNGLGTKGIMLAPYFAAHLAEVMAGNESLHKEVDIYRSSLQS
jgi:glycine oxidase